MVRLLLAGLFLLGHSWATAAEPERHTVIADGHELAVWEKSAASASHVILLLHGRTYSALPDFDLRTKDENLSFMDSLVERGFSVFALDARGYGSTKRDATGWLTPNRAVSDVKQVIDWIHKKTGHTPHVYGWSYGSMVAQLVAQRHPDAIHSLILFGYPFDPARHVVGPDFEYPDRPPAVANTAQHAASDFIVEGSISKTAVQAYVEAALAADPIRVDVRGLHQWGDLDPTKVMVPTLLIQGEHDPIAPTEIQQNLFVNLRTAKKWWIVLAGGDHAALLETPRFEMLDAMQLFVDSVEGED